MPDAAASSISISMKESYFARAKLKSRLIYKQQAPSTLALGKSVKVWG